MVTRHVTLIVIKEPQLRLGDSFDQPLCGTERGVGVGGGVPPGEGCLNGRQIDIVPVSRQRESFVEPPFDPRAQRFSDGFGPARLPTRVGHDHAVGLRGLVHDLQEGGERVGQERLACLNHQLPNAGEVPGPNNWRACRFSPISWASSSSVVGAAPTRIVIARTRVG